MAWERVPPVATAVTGTVGVFFTWLNGRQGRDQVERMTGRHEHRADRERVLQERRNAYLAALRLARLSVQRSKYERTGASSKLAELEQKWPKRERVQLTIDVQTQLEAFGSTAAQDLAHGWERPPIPKMKNS